ncbi:SDR family NAD(P)-dependent oxidoreductase [Candidatus Puniceispirillum sp.]|nr:SDR family NAD(P)-dependent oxidoreductase [Candidatus Puniceispirillum sp.]
MSKTILITGAGRGIGLEMNRQAALNGCQVLPCARNIKEAPDLAALTKKNTAIKLISLDVTAENSTKQIAADIKCKIDILVCNAGLLNGYGGLEDEAHHSQAIEKVFMTNAAGVFVTVRSFLPHLVKKIAKARCNLAHAAKVRLFHQLWVVKNVLVAMRPFI